MFASFFFHSIRDQLQLLWNMEQNLHVYFFVYCVFAMNSFLFVICFISVVGIGICDVDIQKKE